MVKVKLLSFAIAAVFLISGSASAQSITIVSGNGQMTCPLCPQSTNPFFDPLVVLVKDASGNPLPNATVTWTVTNVAGATGSVANATTTTAADGTSSNNFFQQTQLGFTFNLSYIQSTVTASVAGASVNFSESQALTDPTTGTIQVAASLISPVVGSTLTGPAGSTSTTLVQVNIKGLNGFGVAGIQIKMVPSDANGPTINCTPLPGLPKNTALSDSTGTATCTPVFGGKIGTGQFSVAVGGEGGSTGHAFTTYGPINLQVTSGLPGIIQITSGDKQTGNAGTPLPSPLLAVVQDQAGNPIPDTPVTWTVSQGSATLTNTRTISDANGRVSTNVTLGSSPGQVQIKVYVTATPAVTATFTATVNLQLTALQKLSGDSQSAITGTAFAQPLVVQVNNAGAPVAGVTVQFAVTSGSATLGTAAPTTDSQGRAQTTVQAGTTTGAVVITATVSTFSQTFNLTVLPPGPSITSSSFYNAASFIQGAISPCGLATIVGTGLAPGIQGAVLPPIAGMLPLQVASVTVSFKDPVKGTIFAPIWDVANMGGQESVTVQVPCELSPGAVDVTVNVSSGSKTVTVQLQAASPGIFETVGRDNRKRGVLVRPDGTFATRENPARRGETVYMYVTGLGPVANNVIGTNQVGIPGTEVDVSNVVIVGVNNAGVPVVSATYAPDLIGVYVVAFQVPSDAPAGDLPLAIAVSLGGNLVFGNPSIIPVQ